MAGGARSFGGGPLVVFNVCVIAELSQPLFNVLASQIPLTTDHADQVSFGKAGAWARVAAPDLHAATVMGKIGIAACSNARLCLSLCCLGFDGSLFDGLSGSHRLTTRP